jgi:TolA-binding protein
MKYTSLTCLFLLQISPLTNLTDPQTKHELTVLSAVQEETKHELTVLAAVQEETKQEVQETKQRISALEGKIDTMLTLLQGSGRSQ